MEEISYYTERVDHLGIVAGICREIDLIGQIDRQVSRPKRQVSVGEAVQAMVSYLHSAPFFGQCENYLPHFGPRVTCKIGLLPHILKNDTLKVFVVTSFLTDSRYHIRFNASGWEKTA